MKETLEVLSRYAETDEVFVFPSEVAADFWRRRIPGLAGVSTVRVDRIVSWDTFKENAFPGAEERIPSNSSYRTIFLQAFTKKNAEERLLAFLVPKGYADYSRSFLAHLRGLLPNLKTLAEAVAADRTFPDKALAADFRLLFTAYRAFLDEYGLYEPNYETREKARLDRPAVVFFPEVIADFRDLKALLEATGRVRFVTEKPETVPALRVYENSYQEIRGLLLALGRLLDEGALAEDLAVTFPDLDRYREVLLEQAKLQGVPLRLREGRALSKLPGGRFFTLLREAGASSFHVEDLKALLLDGAYPWKDPASGKALVRIGTLRGCMGGGRELWERALRDLPGDLRPGRQYFRDLEAAAGRLAKAETFRELSVQANSFASRFFDLDAWDPEVLREYQISLDSLSELAGLEEASGVPVEDPFGLWLKTLEDRIYVARQSREGVDVYSYRVSAGIRPRFHFVVNAGQEETRVLRSPFGFLREDYKERLGLGDEDLSEAFLSLYGLSGEEVRFSSSAETRSGVGLPPAYFVSAGRAVPAEDGEGEADAVHRERRYWALEEGGDRPLFRYELEGFRRFRETALKPKASDFTRAPAPKRTALRLYERLKAEDKLSLSSTALETYIACPFDFFSSRALGLAEAAFEVEFEDLRFAGDLHHAAFGLLFKRIRDEGSRFLKQRLEEYRSWVQGIVGEVFGNLGGSGVFPLPPVQAALEAAVAEGLLAFLGEEAERYDGYEVTGVEVSLEKDYSDKVRLRGRLDRISRNPESGGYLLVDYKSGTLATKKQIQGLAKDEKRSFQLPFYVLLAGLAELPAEEAVYYSVKKGGYTVVLGGEGAFFAKEDWVPIDEALRGAIAAAASGLELGDYRAKTDTCRFCGFRRICRTKYSLR